MTEATNTTPTEGEQNTAPAKTPREKLVEKYNKLFEKRKDIDKQLSEIVAEVAAIDALASLTVGAAVFITVGRGDKATEVQGTIIGERVEEDGTKTFKVSYGSGFDADIAVVPGSKVKAVPPVAAAE